MNNKEKYIEYQLLNKNNMIKGLPKLIIHISGASGSGKTTLGNKLKNNFGNKIVVKDIDNLREEYYGNKEVDIIEKNAYQKFIDDYIYKINKPLIFVGLNNYPWLHKDIYYNMHSNHNFYIDLDNKIIIKQKCIDYLKNENLKNKIEINDMIHNKKFIMNILEDIKKEYYGFDIIEINNKWKEDYKYQGYRIISREEIYDIVSKILNNNLSDGQL